MPILLHSVSSEALVGALYLLQNSSVSSNYGLIAAEEGMKCWRLDLFGHQTAEIARISTESSDVWRSARQDEAATNSIC